VNETSLPAIRLLESLAHCNEALIELCLSLRSSPHVTNVQRRFDCRAYETGVMIEAYAEAELTNGNSICWWLELNWNEPNWLIEASVLVNDNQGQMTLKEFQDKTANSVDDLVVQLRNAISELVASADAIDLKAV